MILSEPCQNSVLDAPERGTVRKRIRFQNPKPKLREIGGVWKWFGQWRDADGRKRGKILGQKSKMTESQAKAALAAIVHPINCGFTQSTRPVSTFAQYVEDVFIPFKQKRWKEGSTDETTIQHIRSHLVPELGREVLSAIEREDLQSLLDLKAQGLSKSVVAHLRWTLNSIFKLAWSYGCLSKNPAAELIIPKHCEPGRPRRVLTPDEIDQYLSALGIREYVAARLALIEGMRPGEFLARRWSDMSEDLVRVDTRIYRGRFDTPKNGKPRESAISDGTLRDWPNSRRLR